MKTRYSSLTLVKKNLVDKSERTLQEYNKTLARAKDALRVSLQELNTIEVPQSGTVSQIKASSTLFQFQRAQIEHNRQWVDFAQNQVNQAKEELKKEMIEYEKFKYLELEELKKLAKELQIAQAKELDEIALLTFKKRI